MRKLWINLLAPAALLTAATFVWSQGRDPDAKSDSKPPTAKDKDKEAPAKSQLELMLEIALKSNPDIRVAEAKAREADAELNRTRLAVTQKVVVLYNNLESARANLKLAERDLARLEALGKTGVAAAERDAAEAKVMQAKADLAKLEAEVPFLLGQQKLKWQKDDKGQMHLIVEASAEENYKDVLDRLEVARLVQGGGVELRVETREPNKSMSDKLRAALETPITVELKRSVNLDDFLTIIRDKHPDIQILDKSGYRSGSPVTVRSVNFKAAPLGVVLQWLEDEMGDNRIVVRDYGLLIVPRDKIPPGAMHLEDFMKSKDKDAPKAKDEKK